MVTILQHTKSPVQCSDNTLDSINVVTLCWARLVPGWVTVFGWVNRLSVEPGTQAYSAGAHPLWLCSNEYPTQAGEVNRHIAWHTSPYLWSRSVRWCLAKGLACGDQRRPMLYKYTFTLLQRVSSVSIANITSQTWPRGGEGWLADTVRVVVTSQTWPRGGEGWLADTVRVVVTSQRWPRGGEGWLADSQSGGHGRGIH